MAQTLFVPKETDGGESRVAASPESVKRLSGLGFDVVVESGAGAASRVPDAEFEAAGAKIGKAGDAGKADVVLKVRRPDTAEIKSYKRGAVVIATMDPFDAGAALKAMADAGLTSFAMELMPRITRAQSMDVLSSQANLAGYRAVIDAAAEYDRALPMMMTAAGTVPAAKVFVMGAGVAGLQAIATARRLGAVVTATDVRAAAGEQVASLGAKFVMTDALKDASGEGGYARELTDEEKKAQSELVAGHIAKQDIVITTALIPGRPAPKLVSAAMVASMRPGSVVVDLAVERGGNVEGAKAGEIVATKNGVKIIGYANVPGRVAASSSLLYAKNLVTFLETMVDKEKKTLSIDMEDELVKATMLTHDGAVVNERFKDMAASAPAKDGKAPATRKSTSAKEMASDPQAKKAAKGTEPGLDAAPKTKATKTRSASSGKTAAARTKPASKTD